MKLTVLYRRVVTYITHDLREIILPSSLPNPPGYVPPPRRPIKDYFKMFAQVVRGYVETWDEQKLRERVREHRGEAAVDKEVEETKQELKNLAEEFGVAARGGAAAMKPFLQNLWNTRAVAYRDAVQQFIVGYKEGFQEANRPDIPPELAKEVQQQQQQAKEQQEAAGQESEVPAAQSSVQKDVAPTQQAAPPQRDSS